MVRGRKCHVIFFFLLVVGLGGLFQKISASCGNDTAGCSDLDFFGYPFPFIGYISGDCGYPGLAFGCSDLESRPVMNISGNLYRVLSNHQEDRTIRVVGMEVEKEECPRPMHNFTLPATSPFSDPYKNNHNITYFYNCSSGHPQGLLDPHVEEYGYGFPCLNINTTTTQLRSFAFSSEEYGYGFDWYKRNCQESVVVPVKYIENSPLEINMSIKAGFELKWSTPEESKDCEKSGGQYWFNQTIAGVDQHACSCPELVGIYVGPGTISYQRKLVDKVCHPIQNTTQQPGLSIQLKIILGVCSGIGLLLLVALFICRRKFYLLYGSTLSHWKSKIKSSANMEAFLESCGCHGLQRYKYSQVKKMTNTFKEKLGQGGFGSVFKGKLPDGRLVAVKLLDESKGNGQDFINEVATIGWTNHVNVVRLLGLCCNGNKRALVYEFMPNGSLEKFIYNRKNTGITNPPLGSEKLYQIALGIAKGLEYLHCGCNTRILHFDIKPHNILLDQDFCPKIADFGLAKLCQTRESIVSMHVARGTMGYIAPEVTCTNFGGVSHKSDVYSYGMMILEMIGGRKNIDITVENTSEIYFPQWIYNHIQRDIDVGEAKEFYTERTTKRMIMVALWCIQTQPSDRPSISKVVEMLEGNAEELQMPSNPFQGSLSRSSP